MTMARVRVLIADDEPLARRRLAALLSEHADFEVVAQCASGPEVIECIRGASFDAVFLDIEMPELNGLAVARALQEQSATIVVFATAHDRFAEEAFDVEALDYLLKPFDAERLSRTLARIREELGARALDGVSRFVRHGDIEIDVAARRVRRAGEVVVLRRKEFEVLLRLLRHPGEVITRRELMSDVWGYKDDVVSRTLDTHVFELRRKLGHSPPSPGYIETIMRVGYRVVACCARWVGPSTQAPLESPAFLRRAEVEDVRP